MSWFTNSIRIIINVIAILGRKDKDTKCKMQNFHQRMKCHEASEFDTYVQKGASMFKLVDLATRRKTNLYK